MSARNPDCIQRVADEGWESTVSTHGPAYQRRGVSVACFAVRQGRYLSFIHMLFLATDVAAPVRGCPTDTDQAGIRCGRSPIRTSRGPAHQGLVWSSCRSGNPGPTAIICGDSKPQ